MVSLCRLFGITTVKVLSAISSRCGPNRLSDAFDVAIAQRLRITAVFVSYASSRSRAQGEEVSVPAALAADSEKPRTGSTSVRGAFRAGPGRRRGRRNSFAGTANALRWASLKCPLARLHRRRAGPMEAPGLISLLVSPGGDNKRRRPTAGPSTARKSGWEPGSRPTA
jgi:hypothetical protein